MATSTISPVTHWADVMTLGQGGSLETVTAAIDVFGRTVHFQVRIEDGMAPLSMLVPLARRVCDRLLEAVLAHETDGGALVSCRKGCSACCSYLVAVSLPEVFQLRRELSQMPADDRLPILKACVRAARAILHSDITAPTDPEQPDLSRLSGWYAEMNLVCPFLEGGLCGIYAARPLVCREYYVRTPQNDCFIAGGKTPAVVPLPVSVAEVLGQMAAEVEQTPAEAMILSLAMIGTDTLSERAGRLWPAVELVRLFFARLERQAAHRAAADRHEAIAVQ